MSTEFKGTTICAVRKNGKTAIAGDGQVTMGESVVFKNSAKKVRRIYNGKLFSAQFSVEINRRHKSAYGAFDVTLHTRYLPGEINARVLFHRKIRVEIFR